MTPEAKKVIERSLRHALQLGHPLIRTEHLLLAMLEETDSVTARVLKGYLIRQDIFTELAKETREKRLAELRERRDPIQVLRDEVRELRAEVERLRGKENGNQA